MTGAFSRLKVVKGVGLYIYDGITIYWFDQVSNTQTSLTSFGMNGINSFQVTVTAPSNLTSGKTYDVQIEGGSGLISQLPFQAT